MQIIAIYLSLAVISLAVFSQTIHYNFVNFDDDLYVYDASAIKAGLTIKGIARPLPLHTRATGIR